MSISAIHVPQRLLYDVQARQLAPGRGKAPGDGAWYLAAHQGTVEPAHGQDAEAGGGDEGLLGHVQVVGLQVIFSHREVQRASQPQSALPGVAAQRARRGHAIGLIHDVTAGKELSDRIDEEEDQVRERLNAAFAGATTTARS